MKKYWPAVLFFIVTFFTSCNTTPKIVQKNYEYEKVLSGTHRYTFDIHLENIGNSGKIPDLVKNLIYGGKNFDEYMVYTEKKFIGDSNEADYPPFISEDGTEYFHRSELIENYSITHHSDSYIIFKYETYFYCSGAAHGNTLLKYFIIDLFQERKLEMNDLINQVPDAPLSGIIEANYKINHFLRENIWPPDTININKGIVELVWDTYSITPYSYGIIKIEIPNGIAEQYLTNKGKELKTMTLKNS